MGVVILGRTYGDAEDARDRFAGQLPELREADVASTFAVRVLDGRRATKAYVAPRTREMSRSANYRHAVLLMARSLKKTPGADPVVYQLGDDGSVTAIDVDRLDDLY
jgi:hypothetical protein